ncbi:putative Methylated-DNA--protein-cysteine methyltransferase [Hypsibius exemplaris]|uniref:Methylated-DNA--protein-cysteine methyltransferase n=1 Tax=Hypsibius exemplaris TaxID=2072580 RepID=A0A1W0WDQ9_HYPEX|nr:putative Methylated-DNA--protein-cysteine methyltransferase [Hypsibius exemplaris]
MTTRSELQKLWLTLVSLFMVAVAGNSDTNCKLSQIDSNQQAVLTASLHWLDCYFHHTEKLSGIQQPPVCWIDEDDTFRGKCLRKLGEVAKMGCTVSYSALAAAAGNKAAARAAGTAMSSNPVGILIPCHRVLPKSGIVGNYAGGSRVKKFLLEHESKFAKGSVDLDDGDLSRVAETAA